MSGHRQKRGGLRKNDGTEIMLFLWQRYVYKFVTYITLCEAWWDFDITHVFSLTTQKVIFVTLLCISSREHMCSVVLLVEQRLATHMPFFSWLFDVCIIWRFVFFLSRQNVLCWDSVIYIIARMNLKRRYVYKFVTYMTLCKSRGDFDITHVFSLTAKKVVVVTFFIYVIAWRYVFWGITGGAKVLQHTCLFSWFLVCV